MVACQIATHDEPDNSLPCQSHADCSSVLTVVVVPLVPLCRGDAGLLVTSKYGYFRNLLPLVSVVGLFSPLFFLICLCQISLHVCDDQ